MYFQRKGEVATGNPCPICRDEYLTVHYKVDIIFNTLKTVPVSPQYFNEHGRQIIIFRLKMAKNAKLAKQDYCSFFEIEVTSWGFNLIYSGGEGGQVIFGKPGQAHGMCCLRKPLLCGHVQKVPQGHRLALAGMFRLRAPAQVPC